MRCIDGMVGASLGKIIELFGGGVGGGANGLMLFSFH